MYKEIREAWLAEQKEGAIRTLNSEFFERAAGYLRLLESLEEGSELVKVKRERVRYMLMDLIELRLEKMLSSVTVSAPINLEALTQKERGIYDELRGMFEVRESEKELDEEDYVVVRMLVDLPEIVGLDLQIYGPFKAEDVATLPRDNAIVLIRKGVAVPIKVDSKGDSR